MICRRCRDAGDLTKVLPSIREDRRADMVALAADLHGVCPGGTWCDCQHAGMPNDRRDRRG